MGPVPLARTPGGDHSGGDDDFLRAAVVPVAARRWFVAAKSATCRRTLPVALAVLGPVRGLCPYGARGQKPSAVDCHAAHSGDNTADGLQPSTRTVLPVALGGPPGVFAGRLRRAGSVAVAVRGRGGKKRGRRIGKSGPVAEGFQSARGYPHGAGQRSPADSRTITAHRGCEEEIAPSPFPRGGPKMIDRELAALLVCPKDHVPLKLAEPQLVVAGESCHCRGAREESGRPPGRGPALRRPGAPGRHAVVSGPR